MVQSSWRCRPELEHLDDRCLPSVAIGAMGDSYSDETMPQSGIPNWIEILVASGRGDFGLLRDDFPAGDPRRGSMQSYEYNFALGGARASSFAGCGPNGQTGCALGRPPRFRTYATAGAFDFAVLEIAGNDFIQDGIFGFDFLVLPYPLYPPGLSLFNGTRNSYFTGLNLATANGSAPVGMLLANLPDLSQFPFAGFLPPTARANFRTWVAAWNEEIAQGASQRGYGVFDLWSLWEQMRQANGATVHGIRIEPGTWDGRGGAQGMHYYFLQDGLHATPIAHALLANRFLQDLNARYGTNLPLLTPKEMVTLSLLDPQRDPIALAGGPYVVHPGKSLTLEATGSTDPNPGDIPFLQFAWDVNGDLSFDDAFGYQPSMTWEALRALGISPGGSYPVRVRVDDTFGGRSTSEPVMLHVAGLDAFAITDLQRLSIRRNDPGGG